MVCVLKKLLSSCDANFTPFSRNIVYAWINSKDICKLLISLSVMNLQKYVFRPVADFKSRGLVSSANKVIISLKKKHT